MCLRRSMSSENWIFWEMSSRCLRIQHYAWSCVCLRRLSLRELGLGGLRLFQEQRCPNQLVHFISLWLSSCSLVADDQLHMMAILPFRRRKAGFPDFFVSRICWDFPSARLTRHKIHSERSAPRAGFPPHWVSTLSAHRIAVRRSPASAELTRQVEKSTPAAYEILDFAVWQSSRKMSSNLGLMPVPVQLRTGTGEHHGALC